MIWNGITKVETNIFKGLAILMIAIHNFMHRFPTPKENEMKFMPENVYNLFDILLTEPAGIIRALFSYFGHFGVQVFIFLSAYGLMKKYAKNESDFLYVKFIFDRLEKIYPMFLLAIVSYFGFMFSINVIYNGMGFAEWFIPISKSFFFKFSLLYNFYPGTGFSLVGPWWFLSFIFQFYLVFPFILAMFKRFGNVFLIYISLSCLIISLLTKGYLYSDVSVFFTPIGHMPVLCLGIYLAQDKPVKLSNWLFIVSIVAFVIGNFNEYAFLLSHFFFCVLLLCIFSFLTKKIKEGGLSYKICMFFGTISMPLFLVNGFLRKPWESMAHEINNELITIALCLLFLMISSIYSVFLLRIGNKVHYSIKAKLSSFY
ncbi:acyltransferase [Psychromonas sp. MB-3u-54]|uniref:acyltransferase family protein n=1 Tax=Psychromonas sp. MB-3u-54 TaxID=2058319 RepID=UPI000C34186F|nr:acyltransferase [Psychromonas sp. MB-3u-54]PKH01064.1 acyltransferase [Psychromonas sp. MB-3u-54]